jgi:hypothetical protein
MESKSPLLNLSNRIIIFCSSSDYFLRLESVVKIIMAKTKCKKWNLSNGIQKVGRKEFITAVLFFAEVIEPIKEQLYDCESDISFNIRKKQCVFRNLLECICLECGIEKSSIDVFCSDTHDPMFNWVCIEGIENLFTLLTYVESFPNNLRISNAGAQFRMYNLCSLGDDMDFRHDLHRICTVRWLRDNYGGDLFSNVVVWLIRLVGTAFGGLTNVRRVLHAFILFILLKRMKCAEWNETAFGGAG